MKTFSIKNLQSLLLIGAFFMSFAAIGQIGGWKADLVEDSGKALDEMIEQQPKLQSYKDKSYGYAVFPKVTKGAFGVGGAGGKGIVYKNHVPTGESTLSQVTLGFQAGGQ